jgi:ABC-type uncharacterized transport system substrate-binding protein
MRLITVLAGLALVAQATAAGAAPPPARCLYVSSYHAGYEWNDSIEHGLESTLQNRCELRKFYMDGKRNLGEAFAKDKALEAKQLVETWKPDVIIAADDNVSKFLIMPYYKNAAIPVVFCGLNWTAEPYGYPYRNATGMVEVGPIKPLLAEVLAVVKNPRRGVFLSADEMTQTKEFAMSRELYKRRGITMTHTAVRTLADWQAGFSAAQENADFIIIGNHAGIKDWDEAPARRYVHEHARRFTVTYLEWMAPYAMLTMAKIADEQGEWSGKVAVLILNGTPPSKIPVVANRRWNMYVNTRLLDKAGIRVSTDILQKAVKVE